MGSTVKHQPVSLDTVNRRRFLKLSLAGVSALGLGNCLAGNRRAHSAKQTGVIGALAQRHRLPDRPAPPAKSRVAVVRASGFPSHQKALERAIELAGGLAFIQPGKTVLLKPAVNSTHRYPATTDPETVWIVAELVKEAGGKPFVADRTMFLRSTETAFRETAITDAAGQAGIPCRSLDDDDSIPIPHPLAEHWWGNTIRIYASAVAADHIINLCTPRTHFAGDFTMSMKNNVGVVNALSRLPMHAPSGLKDRLAEINLVTRPSLIVMDGRQGFTDGGPDAGDLARPGFIAAGSDPVAIDAVGLAHLRLEGTNEAIGEGSIWKIPMMKRAVEIGAGVGSGRAIALIGVDPAAEARLRAQMA
jgi:uncharacterized protein (DUF362 family)